MSTYQLVEICTVADGAAIGKCNASAFYGETWWRMMWPASRTRDSLVKAVGARTPRNLLQHRDIRRHQKVICVETGEVVGYARWELPSSHTGEWLEAQTPEVDQERRQAIETQYSEADFDPLESMMGLDRHVPEWQSKYQGDSKSLALDYLAVRPDHQHKGVGSLLVKSGIEVADKLGLDIFVLAMGRNALGLYLKAGFELLDERSESLKPCGYDESYDTFFLVKRQQHAL